MSDIAKCMISVVARISVCHFVIPMKYKKYCIYTLYIVEDEVAISRTCVARSPSELVARSPSEFLISIVFFFLYFLFCHFVICLRRGAKNTDFVSWI